LSEEREQVGLAARNGFVFVTRTVEDVVPRAATEKVGDDKVVSVQP
jgi:hypothetical protein